MLLGKEDGTHVGERLLVIRALIGWVCFAQERTSSSRKMAIVTGILLIHTSQGNLQRVLMRIKLILLKSLPAPIFFERSNFLSSTFSLTSPEQPESPNWSK